MPTLSSIIRLGADASGAQKTITSVGKSFGNVGKQAKTAAAEASDAMRQLERVKSNALKDLKSSAKWKDLNKELGVANEQFSNVSTLGLDPNDPSLLMMRDRISDIKRELQDLVDVALYDAEAEWLKVHGSVENANKPIAEQVSLWGRLKQRVSDAQGNLGNVASRVASIGAGARASNPDLRSVVSSIRRIGIVSLGLRVAGGMFGRLRSIVSSYVNENTALKAQVDALKASMGQALAPVINMVANAFAAAMPYIIGFANAVGTVLSALFGKGWTAAAAGANKVAKATGGAASAQKELNRQLLSFDTITKLHAENSAGGGGGGGGGSSGLDLTQTAGKTPAWVESFRKSFTDLFGSDEFKDANLGGKIGQILQTGIKWVGDSALTFDWSGAGTKVRKNFDSFMESDWAPELSRTIGILLGGLGEMIAGYLQPDWEKLQEAYKKGGLLGATNFIGGLLQPLSPYGMFKTINEQFVKPLVDGLKEKLGIGGEEAGQSWKDRLKTGLRGFQIPTLNETIKSVSGLFSKFWGVLGLPDISVGLKTVWLAKGGILDGAQLIGGYGRTAIGAGEAGREAVLPLDQNTGWMDDIANRVAARMRQAVIQLEATIPVNIDGKEVARGVTKIQKKFDRAMGG